MAMSNTTRKELGKCRELLWMFLPGKKCFFCKQLLLPNGIPPYVKFGNASGAPIDVLGITQHHKDENHDNNDLRNIVLCHESCHKSHHAVKIFKNWRNGGARRAA